MSSNSTNTGAVSAENVITIVGMGISLCISFITFLTTILTCTYIVIKSRFKDKQDTNIEISTKTTKDGNVESTVQIELKNNETYTLSSKKFDNNKKSSKKDNKNQEIDKEDDLREVLENNREGDSIIADTRNTAIRGAFNTVIKFWQINALKQDGSNKAPLEVSALYLKPKVKEDGEKEEIVVCIDNNDSEPELLGNLTNEDNAES